MKRIYKKTIMRELHFINNNKKTVFHNVMKHDYNKYIPIHNSKMKIKKHTIAITIYYRIRAKYK